VYRTLPLYGRVGNGRRKIPGACLLRSPCKRRPPGCELSLCFRLTALVPCPVAYVLSTPVNRASSQRICKCPVALLRVEGELSRCTLQRFSPISATNTNTGDSVSRISMRVDAGLLHVGGVAEVWALNHARYIPAPMISGWGSPRIGAFRLPIFEFRYALTSSWHSVLGHLSRIDRCAA
jgi:hypothetical protein